MRLAVICCLALSSTLIVSQPPAAAASTRASVTTPVLPATAMMFARPVHPDSAAPPESTTYLQFVGICPSTGCGQPLCSKDSITITVGGSFPNDCFFVRRIDLYEPPNRPALVPEARWVRVIVDDGACLGRACTVGRTPWSGSITMPPLPARPYVLNVAVIRVSCSDSVPPPPWPVSSFPFAVEPCDSSPPPSACLFWNWDRFGSDTGCDVTVTPAEPARLTLELGSRATLAGLQGGFELRPATLQITNIEATGAAAGMKVTWAQTATGAQFVMFADQGGFIPPPPADGSTEPVLTVTVSAPAGGTIPSVTDLLLQSLLGADPEGHAVPLCPIVTLVYVPPPHICSGAGCDFNHDSFTDVRDLVLMVHCLHSRALCPDFFDCDGNGSTTIDDVLCCAWKILRVQPCTNPYDCPPDSGVARPDPAVRVSGGVPSEEGHDVLVPIHIDGADHIGAARLAMRFPADRWSLVGLDSDDSAWLTLVGEEHGEAVMGAIRTGTATGAAVLNLTLRLRPVTGTPAGGELGVLQADLSATDGVKLQGSVTGPVRPLPGGPTVELSENRPDPFSGETHFTLSLPKAATVDLAVFDLNGRRIATLHRGALAAGVSEFAWDGRSTSGVRIGGGVYFYRAVTDGHAVTRRMVYLGGR